MINQPYISFRFRLPPRHALLYGTHGLYPAGGVAGGRIHTRMARDADKDSGCHLGIGGRLIY